MERFSIWSLILGFIGNRLRRFFRRPDIDFITRYLAIGGITKVPSYFETVDARILEEGEYPRIEEVNKLVDKIEENYKKGHKTFLFCKYGRGRAPMIAICYLMKYMGLSLDNSLRKVRNRRPYIYLNEKQLRFLEDYECQLKRS